MTPERRGEIKRHIDEANGGSPLKDFEDVDKLVFELWDEVEKLDGAVVAAHRAFSGSSLFVTAEARRLCCEAVTGDK